MFETLMPKDALRWHDARKILPGYEFDHKNTCTSEFLIRFSFEEDLSCQIYDTAIWKDGKFLPVNYCFNCNGCGCNNETLTKSFADATVTHWAYIYHSSDWNQDDGDDNEY